MCTPSRRCVPEHSRHMSVPYVTDAHDGFLAVQSKQTRSLCFAFIFRKNSSRTGFGTSASGSGAMPAARTAGLVATGALALMSALGWRVITHGAPALGPSPVGRPLVVQRNVVEAKTVNG
eukprot:scaffold99400_cov55-Phaeocystis_antarctica.AAC.1